MQVNQVRRCRFAAWIAIVAFSSTGPMAFAGGAELELLESQSPSLFFAARDGFAVRDVDGDGRDDFVFSAMSGFSHLLLVVGMNTADQVETKQSFVVPGEDLVAVMAATDVTSAATVYSLSHMLPFSGRLTSYGGWPLEPLRSFETAGVPRAAVVGDANADGSDELIVSFADGILRSYSLATGQVLWQTSTPRPASKLALTQLDADAALEVLVGDASVIVDGATGASQGGPDGGFDTHISIAKRGPTDGPQIISAGWALSAFGADAPWPLLWTHNTPFGVGSLGTYDLERDGRDEIVYGDAQNWASLHFLDGETRQERLTVQTYDYCICAFAQGDLDGDGYQDIGIAEGSLDGSGRQVRARWADLRRGQWTFALESLDGRFVNVALGDLDGDGHPEQVVASESDALQTTIVIHDAETGELKWQSPGASGQPDFPFAFSAGGVVLLEAADRSDIAVYGYGIGSNGRLVVIDGATHQTRFQLDGYQEPLAYRSIEHATAWDYDGDGTADVVAALGTRSIDGSLPIIAIFSGVTGQALAVSPPFGTANDAIVGMELVPATSGLPAAIAVAFSNAIHILDADTFQAIAEQPIVSSGIRVRLHDSAPPHILSFARTGRIDFYDARTLTHVKSVETSGPLESMVPLGDAPGSLLAVIDGRLQVIDATTGGTRGMSDWLGTRLGVRNQLAAWASGANEWLIAVGGDAGYFRHRLRVVEKIFSDGFDVGAEDGR